MVKTNDRNFLRMTRLAMLMAVLALCGTLGLSSCSKTHGNSEEQSKIAEIAGKVWAFSQTHPDGFTIDVRTMTEPKEGIAVRRPAAPLRHREEGYHPR